MVQRRRLIGLAAASALGALGSRAFAQQSAVTLKFHTFVTPTSDTWVYLCKPWMEKVTRESGGRIRFEGYASMQLGGTPVQLYDQTRDGVVDLTWTLPGLTAGRFPRSEVFELPFMMNNPEATSMAFWEYAQGVAAEEYRETRLIAAHTSGPGIFHSRSKAIHSIGDLRGMKVRGPSRQVTRLLAALGAIPVGMPLPNIPDAISKGTIDAAMVPWQTAPSVKLDELCKHHSEFPAASGALFTTTFFIAMNKARYEALPADLKKVIDANSGLATSGWCGKTTASTDPVGRKAAADHGNEIYTLSAAEAAEFVKATAGVADEWVAEMNKRGLDGRKLLDSARALIARHGKPA